MDVRKLLTRGLIAAAAVLLSCAGLVWFVQSQTDPLIYAEVGSLPTTEVALVLGASVLSNGQLSPVLRERVDKAIELYRAGKVSKILVTGDNSTVAHNEVDPMGKYLLEHNIPKEDIFLDHAGFDTYSSMYRARDVFEVTSLAIVSQPFHLPRAVFIARQLGLEAYGAATAEIPGRYTYNYWREIPATIKAVGDLVFFRVPKYLGVQYPIKGDGYLTWGGATTTPTQ